MIKSIPPQMSISAIIKMLWMEQTMQLHTSEVLTEMISLHSSCHHLSLVAPIQSVVFLK